LALSRKMYKDQKSDKAKLVIYGSVRNISNTSKKHIKLRGRLYDKNNQFISEKEVYAGNLFTETEILTKPSFYFSQISDKRGGEANANVNVPQNFGVPFMIIFPNIPSQIGRSEVSLLGSQ